MSVSVAVKGPFLVGEGPHWMEDTKSLLFVDLDAGDVHIWDSVTGQDTKQHLDGMVGFAVPRASGGYIIGKELEICDLDLDTGRTSVICDVERRGAGKTYRFNDGKCDASGRLWAGTMTWKPQEEPPCVLYSLEKDRSLRERATQIHLSNGIAWTADNTNMLLVDSIAKKVLAFDFDIQTGDISKQRVSIDCSRLAGVQEYAIPDGCCMDAEDKLWLTFCQGGQLLRLDPETGSILKKIEFPCGFVSSCCFGGRDYEDLYVTTGSFPPNNKYISGPLAGSIFKISELGVKGLPPASYQG